VTLLVVVACCATRRVVKIPFDEKLALIRQSWKFISTKRHEFSTRLHTKLLQDEAIRNVFDESQLAAHITHVELFLDEAVSDVAKLGVLVPRLELMGKQHAAIEKITPKQFHTFGQALLSAMEESMGKSWKPQIGDAWYWYYEVIEGVATQSGWHSNHPKEDL